MTANVTLWPNAVTVVINRKVFESLTPASRMRCDKQVRAWSRGNWLSAGTRRQGPELLCRRGLRFQHVSNQELAALRRTVQPV